jgi:hypothetical protein
LQRDIMGVQVIGMAVEAFWTECQEDIWPQFAELGSKPGRHVCNGDACEGERMGSRHLVLET